MPIQSAPSSVPNNSGIHHFSILLQSCHPFHLRPAAAVALDILGAAAPTTQPGTWVKGLWLVAVEAAEMIALQQIRVYE